MKSLDGKHLVIVGAGGSIGQEVVRVALSHGSRLTCIDKELTSLGSKLSKIGASDQSYLLLETTLSGELSCIRALQESIDRFGRIDAVICLTGVLKVHSNSLLAADVRESFNSNLFVPLELGEALKHSNRQISEEHACTMLVVSSLMSVLTPRRLFDYALSKAAVEQAFRILAEQSKDTEVQYLTFRTGFVDSPMASQFRCRPFIRSPQTIARRILHTLELGRSVEYPGLPSCLAKAIAIIPKLASQCFSWCLKR